MPPSRCLQLTEWFPENQRQSLDTEEVIGIAAVLVRHIQACASNAYEINELVRAGPSMIDCSSAELGGAVYPTISLSNHACTSNTSRRGPHTHSRQDTSITACSAANLYRTASGSDAR